MFREQFREQSRGEKGGSTMVDTEEHDIAWVLETRGHLSPKELGDDLDGGRFPLTPRGQVARLISFIKNPTRLPAELPADERVAYQGWVARKVAAKELPDATLRLFDP